MLSGFHIAAVQHNLVSADGGRGLQVWRLVMTVTNKQLLTSLQGLVLHQGGAAHGAIHFSL
jgi:hypothetical protein